MKIAPENLTEAVNKAVEEALKLSLFCSEQEVIVGVVNGKYLAIRVSRDPDDIALAENAPY